MSSTLAVPVPGNLQGIRKERLFVASCCALAVSAVAFAVIGDILLTLKVEFVLSNLQVGYIGGAAIWGAMVTILLFGPLCDVLGMRALARAAMVCHMLGAIVMLSAVGFWSLFLGALTISLGNGLIGGACNPLVATLYPDQKTVKLNQFHCSWPAGIVAGGLASYSLHASGIVSWRLRLALVLIPAVIYTVLMVREPFPATSNAEAGVSWSEMLRATFTSRLFWLLLFCMTLTASIEMGPNRWIPAVLEAGGMPGILVLVWISGLMAVLRMHAARPLVRRLPSTGIVFLSVVLAGAGLYLLSLAESGAAAFAAATLFAVGICFIWPTMLGLVAERVPRSGALGLALMGGAGMGVAGLVTAPALGRIADNVAHVQFVSNEQLTVRTIRDAHDALRLSLAEVPPAQQPDVHLGIARAHAVLEHYERSAQLPPIETANAFRSVISSGVEVPATASVHAMLSANEGYGGRMSFRYCVPLAALLALVFGLLFWTDRRRRGVSGWSTSAWWRYRASRAGGLRVISEGATRSRISATARRSNAR